MIDQNIIIIILKHILLQLKSLLSSVSHNVGCLAGYVDLLLHQLLKPDNTWVKYGLINAELADNPHRYPSLRLSF